MSSIPVYFESDSTGENYFTDPKELAEQIMVGDFPIDELMYEFESKSVGRNGKHYVFGMEGLSRALDICLTDTPDNGTYGSHGKEVDNDPECWHGTETMDETAVMVRDGWPLGLEGTHAISEAITEAVGSHIEKEIVEYDIAGEEVDPVAFATGEIDHMCSYTKEVTDEHGKCINVVVHMGVLGDVETSTIMNRGATIISVLDLLKLMGFSTKLSIVSDMNGDGYNHYMTSIMVKDYTDQIDEDLISFCTATPSMHRRINFCLREHMGK